MHDIIDSGTWGKLSSGARTLYPVLCKFTDETFKMVWPGTETLLKLTGFKTKKSLQDARKDLEKNGLISYSAGTGRTSTRYHFRFDYPGSRFDIHLYREKIISLRGIEKYSPGGGNNIPQGENNIPPKEINININNNYSQKQQEILDDLKSIRGELKNFLAQSPYTKNLDQSKNEFVEKILEKYSELEVGEAIRIAVQKGKNGDIRYLEGILRNRQKPKINQNESTDRNIDKVKKLLAEKLTIHLDNIIFKHKYNDTYYFGIIQKSDVSFQMVEKNMGELGYFIRLYDESEKSLQRLSIIK